MKILVINCGSSSIKFQLIDVQQPLIQEYLLAKGIVERIGQGDAVASCVSAKGRSFSVEKEIADHCSALLIVFDFLVQSGAVEDCREIEGVGHRFVHGGEYFKDSVLISEQVERTVEACAHLAPLHNPHNLSGYRAIRKLLPNLPQVAVFDAAFHSTLPPKAYLYAVPYEYYEKDKVRRYGFHGTSHRFVSERFAQIHRAGAESFKLITCHLGNGCSLCAIDGRRSIDTSMGFTPVDGLIMGTRSGEIDPGIVFYLMRRRGYSPEQLEDIFNRKSGLYALSEGSNDMRDLLARRAAGDERARLAIDMFCYRARKYIGAYMAALCGADAIVFTGGIGENAYQIRAEICSGLDWLGIVLDSQRNQRTLGIEGEISAEVSRTKVWVIPTNEELLIARDTVSCILKNRSLSRAEDGYGSV